MTSTKTLLCAALVALAAAEMAGPAAAQAPAPAGDAAKGREKVAMCQGCHGIDGWRTAFPEVYTVPKIAGQHPQYIVGALKAYRSGDRRIRRCARSRRSFRTPTCPTSPRTTATSASARR
jgi:cytochrome c553